MPPPAWRTDKTTAGRGYGARWQKSSAGYLLRHPLCVMCEQLGRTVLAVLVDHIIPHRGDMKLFWDSSNWQSLCKCCHDGAKQRIEKTGVMIGCSVDGLPLDPNHPWNRTDARPTSETNSTENRDG